MRNSEISGKVIVITGASSGFGRGAAIALAEQGALLVLAARREPVLDELVHELRTAGRRALSVSTDVSVREDVEALARAALTTHGRIDVWINNAGVGAIGPFERVPLDDHVRVIETNLLGTLYGTYCAYRQFLLQGSGTLINIASELGKYTVPYYASYAAAKHGVVGLDDALQQEIEQAGHEGIHVCTVLPTAHDTPFFDHAANYTGHAVQAPKPLHEPRDVIETIVRLVRDPRNSEIVGADGVVKVFLRSVAPALAKKLGARQMHKTQMENAPPAEDSTGSLRSPVVGGTDVSGGRKSE